MSTADAPRPHHPLAGAGRIGVRRLTEFAAFLLVLGVLWQMLVTILAIPSYLLPAPPAVLQALTENTRDIGAAALFTIACTLAGMTISGAVAIVLAISFIASETLSRAMMPLIIIIRTIPMIAIAPLIILIFGRGPGNSIGMVALLTFFQIMLAAKKGFLSPSNSALELMHVYGANFWQVQLKVRVPFAIPYIFTGLRIASSSAILCAMFAEWLSGAPGLGRLILDAYSTQDFPLMWAAVLISTATAYLFFTATLMAERIILDWSR